MPKNNQHKQIMLSLLSKGYMITAQRRLLITALCRKKEIISVEDFWLQLRQSYGIGWATVYSNINLLITMGWVVKSGKGIENSKYILQDHPVENNEEYVDEYK